MGKRKDPLIERFLRSIGKEIKIEKAILFGSRARGDNFKNSDYDIIIVSSDFEGVFFTDRMASAYMHWRSPIDADIICYTPKEFKEKSKRIGIVRSAVKEGIDLVSVY